ncbi:MAG: ligand-gated TonB-dependent outer rane channel [Acidobacteria bacterium]|nr:ligand-gated TonB-dependent outer rane channel [Acidobacteriota bacterium]
MPGRASVPPRRRLAPGFLALFLALAGGTLRAQESRDLTSLSVDDLMNVEVTSVSRKGQKVADTAAAVFVISQEEIRRSGATSIPEVLRIVPGLDVARINGNVWAISARGFNGQFANRLLVMIDGRSVYTPLFSGVYWDVQDTLLEDVDRIEVIRGPGGTLWGANAVNGIINIITKSSIETQGALLSAGGGVREGSSGAGRYGGAIGHSGYYRAYAKSFDRPASVEGPNATHDAWTHGAGGFRADWTSSHGSTFTAQGDLYRGTSASLSALVNPAKPLDDRTGMTKVAGESLQFRWASIQSPRSSTTLQAFYDGTRRSDSNIVLGARTFDIDFQHHLKVGDRQDAVWGAGYRMLNDHASGPGLELIRNSKVSNTFSAFIQDEIDVTPRARVTAGTKLLYDSASHLQLQPTLRLLYKASSRQTIWAAATSAVKTPSETVRYGRINVGAFPDGNGGTGLVVLRGNPNLQPERTRSYELGYRLQATADITLDATAFHNDMPNIAGTELGALFIDPTGRAIIPATVKSSDSGEANGAELLLTDAVTPAWNVALGYSFLNVSIHEVAELERSAQAGALTTPRHQAQLRSYLRLPRQLELDSAAYYVGPIGNEVRSYVRFDAQLSWHPARRWELSISGQNLLQSQHTEFVGTYYESQLSTPVRRTVNGKVTWRF